MRSYIQQEIENFPYEFRPGFLRICSKFLMISTFEVICREFWTNFWNFWNLNEIFSITWTNKPHCKKFLCKSFHSLRNHRLQDFFGAHAEATRKDSDFEKKSDGLIHLCDEFGSHILVGSVSSRQFINPFKSNICPPLL